MPALHDSLAVEKIADCGWATIFRDSIAVNGGGGQSVFRRKRSAHSFAEFVGSHFGDRLDVLGDVERHGARAYVNNEDRAALFAEIERLHEGEKQ